MERHAMRIAGFGFRAAVTVETLETLLQQAGTVSALVTLADKADHPALLALAHQHDLPLRSLPREALAGLATQTRSCRIEQGFGTGSVAEACALAAAGPGARLVLPRVTSPDGMATIAVAQGGET
jgi:cobalt-precorrin 5A hydrolase